MEPGVGMMPRDAVDLMRRVRRLFSVDSLRWLLSAECLSEQPLDDAAPARRRPGLVCWLMSGEPLDDASLPVAVDGARSDRAPTAPPLENLPVAVTPRRAGFLRWVASAEVCVEESSPPERSRRGVLGSLLATEEL